MNRRILFLIAAICFIVGSVMAFITYFLEKGGRTWLIIGIVFFVVAIPNIVQVILRKKQ